MKSVKMKWGKIECNLSAGQVRRESVEKVGGGPRNLNSVAKQVFDDVDDDGGDEDGGDDKLGGNFDDNFDFLTQF